MTTSEFEREFDILYNNIMSNSAPSIDAYEKSVFLTKAQEELVVTAYNNFEQNEALIESLTELVTTKKYNSITDIISPQLDPNKVWIASNALSSYSKFYLLPSDLMFITFESIEDNNENECGDKSTVLVKPIIQDEYYRCSKNPFRRPRKREALRLNVDYNVTTKNQKAVEIISIIENYTYTIRYVRKPNPIVLYTEPGLTIEGIDTITECELNPILHKQILERAVQLAAAVYKQ